MTYYEEGADKCTGCKALLTSKVREKTRIVLEMLQNPERLQEERDFAQRNR
jgi:riboflavin synthase